MCSSILIRSDPKRYSSEKRSGQQSAHGSTAASSTVAELLSASARFAQPATLESIGGFSRGRAPTRRSQPGDDAVEVEDEHVGPEDVAAGHLVRFMRDAGRAEVFAELPLAGEHLGLVHAVEPVERVRTGAGDQEDPLVSVAFDPLDRIVGADPGLVPVRRAVDCAAAQVQDRRGYVCQTRPKSRRRLAGPEWALTEAKWP